MMVVLAVIAGCSICDNEALQSVKSPSGEMTAFVFNRGCGATVGKNTQVSIVRGASLPRDAGNALIVDDTISLTVTWLTDTEVLITGPLPPSPVKREHTVEGVAVTYAQP
jgi:hypothetical protein